MAVQYGTTTTEVVNLTFAGDLESYGVAIPSASEGIQLAVGAEYREESLRNMPDEVYRTADAAGFGGPTPQVSGRFNVKEAFLEVLIPIVQDSRGAQDLSLEARLPLLGLLHRRWCQHLQGPAELCAEPRAGGSAAVTTGPSVRPTSGSCTFRRASSWAAGMTSAPVKTRTATVEQCERTGVPAHMYGHVLPNPLRQYNALGGGNPLLDPETADTITAGVVWTPQSIRGLSITLDYYNIDISEAIGSLGADILIQQCALTGDPQFCERIHRDAQYTLWLTRDGYTEVTYQNIGTQVAEGVDLNFNYLLGLGGSGYLAMDLMGSLSDPEPVLEPGGGLRLHRLLRGPVRPAAVPLAPPLPRHMGEQSPAQPLACVALRRRRRGR